MHRRIASRILTLTIAAGLFAAAAACTVSTAEPSNGASTKKDSGKSSSSKGASSDDEGEPDSGASNNGETTKDCSNETTAQSCATCCGYNQQLDDIFAQADETYIQCACTAKCKTACGSFCTDPQAMPSDACITCLDSDPVVNECGPKADEGCNANAACKAFLECEDKAGCMDKPMPDAG